MAYTFIRDSYLCVCIQSFLGIVYTGVQCEAGLFAYAFYVASHKSHTGFHQSFRDNAALAILSEQRANPLYWADGCRVENHPCVAPQARVHTISRM